MVRWLVIGGVAAVALTVYALVDLFVTGSTKLRAFPKPVWIALIVVIPVIGPILWLTIGKNGGRTSVPPRAPDDDPGFLGTIGESADERIKRLEEELRKLGEEDTSGDGTEEPPPAK
jgi:hypothetical protein